MRDIYSSSGDEFAQHGCALVGGGCCEGSGGPGEQAPMSARARRSRIVAGFGFLAAAGALCSRRLPGGVALWPASLVPTWFGISHLVAGTIGYQGCPELGAIPSVMLDRPVVTRCELWGRIDRRLDPPVGRRSAARGHAARRALAKR
jgi:hypothetical protein